MGGENEDEDDEGVGEVCEEMERLNNRVIESESIQEECMWCCLGANVFVSYRELKR